MPYNPNIHNRKSMRLQGYDYSQAGLFYVTICIKNRECLLGEITDGKMMLNAAGNIADEFLKNIPERYHQTAMHEYIVMPNHVHAIIEIMETEEGTVGAIHLGAIHESPLHESPLHESPLHESPLNESPQKSPTKLRDQRRKMLLSKIMGWYKMNTAKHINIMRKMSGVPLWQRNYYDIIIRTAESYYNISQYIIDNPANWKGDKFNLR